MSKNSELLSKMKQQYSQLAAEIAQLAIEKGHKLARESELSESLQKARVNHELGRQDAKSIGIIETDVDANHSELSTIHSTIKRKQAACEVLNGEIKALEKVCAMQILHQSGRELLNKFKSVRKEFQDFFAITEAWRTGGSDPDVRALKERLNVTGIKWTFSISAGQTNQDMDPEAAAIMGPLNSLDSKIFQFARDNYQAFKQFEKMLNEEISRLEGRINEYK